MKKAARSNKFRKLVVCQDKDTGHIFFLKAIWRKGEYVLTQPSNARSLKAELIFSTELGRQVKKYLKRCG